MKEKIQVFMATSATMWLMGAIALASWLGLGAKEALLSATIIMLRAGVPAILAVYVVGALFGPRFEHLLDKGVQAEDRWLKRRKTLRGGDSNDRH